MRLPSSSPLKESPSWMQGSPSFQREGELGEENGDTLELRVRML